ncbi:SRPBCC family protein [Streptomyces sp. NBC_01262]|uniref:SRPBCC family protein n=1 Tax=Streptomyces sp. NBC_01262 TaxID=2903803 RepID=UPI002E2ED47F|nr:SRPBCC family protein [Streptomyces sp. NBC_01262]
MDFTNEFRVSLPVGPAWALLTDLERIAPCMPGAQLTGVEGEEYSGVVKVKVGPMTVQYKGVASFEEQDADARTAVLRARGRDVRGQGNADARITARLVPDGDGTRVTVETRLTITGKVAQFGKGMIEEISKKLLAQFAEALEAAVEEEAPESPPEEAPESPPEASVTAVPVPVMPAQVASVAPLELMSVARGAVLKRAVPALVAFAVVIALVVWLAR